MKKVFYIMGVLLLFALIFMWSYFSKPSDADQDDSALPLSESYWDIILKTELARESDYPGHYKYLSCLFYNNNHKDSVGIVRGPLQYSFSGPLASLPHYHFLGFSIKDSLLISYGWGYKNPDIQPDYSAVIDTTTLNTDESEYYRIVDEDVNGRAYCGKTILNFYEIRNE